jgi:hypothetical protein
MLASQPTSDNGSTMLRRDNSCTRGAGISLQYHSTVTSKPLGTTPLAAAVPMPTCHCRYCCLLVSMEQRCRSQSCPAPRIVLPGTHYCVRPEPCR